MYDSHLNQSDHWWFRGRRKIVDSLLKKSSIIQKDRINILDVGSGAGSMLGLLKQYGMLSILEPDQEMADFLSSSTDCRVFNEPFADFNSAEPFTLISFFDVLEHIEDDKAALEKTHSLLEDDGFLVCTVPAFPFLWSSHDVQSHHKRRYTKKELIQKIEQAGFTIERATFFNSWLFPPIALLRILTKKVRNVEKNDFQIGASFLDTLMYKIFSSESVILRFLNLPVGVSIFCIARKNTKL